MIQPIHFFSKATVVICFLESQGKVLFLQRAVGKAEENTWTAPGGKLEPNETPMQGVLREVQEETGLFLDEKKLEHCGRFYVNIIPNWNFILHIFRYSLEKSIPKIILNQVEHQNFQWVCPSEALSLPLIKGGSDCLLKVYDSLSEKGSRSV